MLMKTRMICKLVETSSSSLLLFAVGVVVAVVVTLLFSVGVQSSE